MMTVLRRMKKNPQYGKVTKDTKTELSTGRNGGALKRWFEKGWNLKTLLPPLPPVQMVRLCDLCGVSVL
jgi:hypothetical protein